MNINVKKEPVGLVTKPQFDMNIFEKGAAIKVVAVDANKTNLHYGFSENCLITRATPLAIEIGYCDGDGDIQAKEIQVGEVVNGYVDITILK